MNYNIIGAGRVGKSIAMMLSSHSSFDAGVLCNSTLESALRAVKQLHGSYGVVCLAELPPADCTWLTCNDDAIEPVVQQLAEQRRVKTGSFVIHCSGVLSSKVLKPLQVNGCKVASIHPLKAFKNNAPEPDAFKGVHCVTEGDEEVCQWLTQLFTQAGAHVCTIMPEAKKIYHAAATIASNYLITLAACSEELLLKAGLSAEQSRQMICHLMQGNITNLQKTPAIADALTGPLMRGDANTIALHLQAIQQPILRKLYQTAGIATLPLTRLSEEKTIELMELLN